ncbi:DUF1450 domain-containing protein [Guptibacillus hwajinpoensis]|uniref:DUF1450 domain-containing protein n=1 Tax=Guptibacillus hwajinpoensis TaxID=208199 RepID=UPI001CFE81BD|nr:DUF1450 domain-containing protein [Pseudalkalibacillus hwajinpoensis]WLR61072.1 DUF1450 domain-containing protein [Pseudalkalibacillus hwajinpoensis]
MKTIEFCAGNLRENKRVWEALEEIHDIELIDYGCLGYCGNCYSESFAIVDGRLVNADTSESLIEKIMRKLNDEN